MSKLIKILLSFTLLLTVCLHFAYATNITENEEDLNTVSSDLEESSAADYLPTTSEEDSNSSILSNSGVTSVSQLSSYSEANLELNNILNIILIAIGVLIILFAIAILIRLKN